MISSKLVVFLVVVAVFLVDGVIHPNLVSAQPSAPPSTFAFEPTLGVVDENVAPFSPRQGDLRSVLYDPQEQMAFFVLRYTNPSAVCRYSLEHQAFNPEYCIPVGDVPSYDVSESGFIYERVAYFSSKAQNPSFALACFYNISLSNFSFIGCNSPPTHMSANHITEFTSAVVDNATGIGYFGAKARNFRGVCAMNLSAESSFSFIVCNLSDVCQASSSCPYRSGLVHEGVGYFATLDSQVCQYSLLSSPHASHNSLTFKKCIKVNSSTTIPFTIAALDRVDHYGYFAGLSKLSSAENLLKICKFQLDDSLFKLVNCITQETPPYSQLAASDRLPFSQIVSFPISAASASTIFSFNLSSSNFSFHSSSPLPIPPVTSFLDAVSQTLYVSARNPTQVCRIEIADLAVPSSPTCTSSDPVANNAEEATSFTTGLYDPATQTAYFASRWAICKYDTSDEALELVGCMLPPSFAGFGASVFDNSTGTAVFAGQFKVCTVARNFSVSECVQSNTAVIPTSAAIDSNRSLVIFSGQKTICVYSVSPLLQLHCQEENTALTNNILSSVYDIVNAILYVGLMRENTVCRFQISALAPFVNSSLGCILMETSARPGLHVALLDERTNLAYFGLDSAELCQINVSSSNFSFIRCESPSYSGSGAQSGFADWRNNKIYLLGSPRFSIFKISPATSFFSVESEVESRPLGVTITTKTSVFDRERSTVFVSADQLPARVFRLSLNTFSCSNNNDGAVAVVNNQSQLQQGPLWITELKNCHLLFENVSLSGGINFVSNPMQDAAISLHNVTFVSTSSSLLTFSQNVDNSRVSLSNVQNEQGSSLVRFSPLSRISSSDVLFINNSLTQGSFVSFSSSTSSPLDSTTSFTFESNEIVSSSASPSASIANFDNTPFNLKSSKWNFTCTNRWVNGYVNQFKELTFNNDQVSRCDKKTASPTSSRSKSISQSLTNSLSPSTSESLSASNTLSGSSSRSNSETSSLSASESTSASLSESIYCFNLNQQQCSDVGPGNCHFCSNRNLCVPSEQDCNCAPLDESLCPLATGCKYCSNANVCVEDDLDCKCYVFEETACKLATSTCRWCPNFDSCLPLQEQCYCSTLGETACTRLTQNKCTYCSQQEICLPTTDFNKETCSCLNMNSTNCQTSKCSWCENYQTCGLPNWDCDCTSLSNSSASSCSIDSNNHCKLCQEESVCVDSKNFTCRCENFTESVCDSSSCRWCDTLNSCTIPENDECSCYLLRGEKSCNEHSNGKCHFCSDFDSCLPLNEKCYCSTLSQLACTSYTHTKCTYCPQQEICLPTTDSNEDTCSCLNMNSSNCQESTCSWCDNYQTCGLPNWDCNCTSLSNSSSSCSVNSNNHCTLCKDESVCVDAKKNTCRCENFTQFICDSSSCKWCDTLNSCTIPDNKNCTCNWLRFEDSCNRNSNNKCSWCATSSDTGEAKHNSLIANFNYCINNDGKDQCQCSYLSPSFCAAASDPSLNKNLSLSTSCRYCPVDDICAHPGNDRCECGNFEQHACVTTSLCTWKDPVLTFDGAVMYCSAASITCSPVMCEGILTKASCDSSGCSWNSGTSRCESNSVCFNFFVAGFTPQPMLLWVIGLLKDVLVVFLVGAYANTFTRPIMKFVTAVKKKVLKQTHIKQQMMEETVYMCDKHCRDDLPISFPQYVERVCESVFELENDDLLDEGNRRVLFDAVAYTLFDNMIWVDIDLLQKKDNEEEINFNKQFGFGDRKNELSQHEMKDLTVETVDVKDEGNDDEQQNNDQIDGLTMEELLENFTANVVSKLKNIGVTRDADVNIRAQLFGRFYAAVGTQYDTYLKTKNVDVLKIKVFLTAQDFESAVTLTRKVDESLIERASAYVFYDHSRSRKVCAAASANTFPPALSLIYYSLALLFLFVSSMITVYFFENFQQMVQSCDEFIPLGSNASASNITTTTADPRSTETVIDGSYLTGAYFLLGFRLLNSSAFSTAILVFVKVVRGIYQRFSGIYTLSLQERIPLMALYSDRFTHVMLFLYALLVLPFALCGPTYGSSFGVYCWVPIFIAAAILIGDAIVLYVSRRFSALKNRLLAHEAESDEKQQALSKTFGDLNENFEDFLDSSPSKKKFVDAEKSVAVPSATPTGNANSEVENEEKKNETSGNLKQNLLSSYTPREGDDDNGNKLDEQEGDSNELVVDKTIEERDAQLAEDVVKKQSSIESTSPVNLRNALLVFIMTEEVPVIVISLALQLSFNYAALLHYGDAFGLRDDQSLVYKRDYDSRSLSCIVSMFENDVSSFVSGLSSFVPFM